MEGQRVEGESALPGARRAGADKPDRIVIALAAAAGLFAYILLWQVTPYDVGRWLLPWYRHIVAHGQLGAFEAPFSNYTPPYLYLLSAATSLDGLLPPVTLIKLLSVAGVGALALATRSLLVAAQVGRPSEKAFLVFILPSVALNAPALAQCDAMWAAACIAAVAAAVRERHLAMLLWCGVAIAFKAQAVFLAPFIVALLISRRVPVVMWLVPPAVYAAAMLPAWLLGWPALDLATIYLRQAEYFITVGNASNPWIFIAQYGGQAALRSLWLGYAAAAIAVAIYIAAFARRRLSTRELIAAALLSSILVPFLLPKMHERYFFLADILAFALAYVGRDRQSVTIAVLVQLGSVLAVLGYFADTPLGAMYGSVLMLGAILMLLKELRPLAGRHAERSRLALPIPQA